MKLTEHTIQAIATYLRQHGPDAKYTILASGAVKFNRPRVKNAQAYSKTVNCNRYSMLAKRARVCHGYKGEGLWNVN